MKLKQIKIEGFRGFNNERTIDFDDRLTLMSAPNSHGKTSITEALEFLLFGETSKVAHAYSKEEYRDSYRNRHFPAGKPAVIQALFEDKSEKKAELRLELDPSGIIRRYVNGDLIAEWPFSDKLVGAAPPFVLQHALKNLLLVAPTDRFQGFARLLGLYDVDAVQQAIVNLCTKPEASIPENAKRKLSDFQTLEGRVATFQELQPIIKDFKRGPSGMEAAYKKVRTRAEKLLGRSVKPAELHAAVVSARDEAASKVYAGSVGLKTMSQPELARLSSLDQKVEAGASATFIERYARLAVRDATERLKKEAQFLALGTELLIEKPDSCPFCGQKLEEPLRKHIASRHEDLKSKVGVEVGEGDPRRHMARELSELRQSLEEHRRLLEDRSRNLLTATNPENKEKVCSLLGKGNEASWTIVQSASATTAGLLEAVRATESKVPDAITNCETAIKSRNENIGQVEALASNVQQYLSVAKTYRAKLDELELSLSGPERLLRQAIDATAGTTELSALIEVLEKQAVIERTLRAREVLEGLKDLKKYVEQTVGAIELDLTGSVMSWYKKIRTTGDPDVHFSGFAMERTKAGDFKSKRVKVSARSYGVELASAVSSLSESKLNALGLCMSIATALRAPGPWDFLILDDPIQSWDEEHEVQFIEVLRSLTEKENKQVILLSHRDQWVNQVSLGCRSINGIRYRITGYTQEGPHITEVEWTPVDQRLREVNSIVSDPKAMPVRLQQAEEEIRIAACQLTAEIAKKKLGRDRSPHNINSKDLRAILNEAGCPAALVDRVAATFGTTDDAHHAPKDYQPNPERIRQYHGALLDLKQWGNQ
jgi:DNA repair exonuclease SbcCD ATPase subunit